MLNSGNSHTYFSDCSCDRLLTQITQIWKQKTESRIRSTHYVTYMCVALIGISHKGLPNMVNAKRIIRSTVKKCIYLLIMELSLTCHI